MKRKKKISASLLNWLKPNFQESKSYRSHFEEAAHNLDAVAREEFANKFFKKTFQQDLKIAV